MVTLRMPPWFVLFLATIYVVDAGAFFRVCPLTEPIDLLYDILTDEFFVDGGTAEEFFFPDDDVASTDGAGRYRGLRSNFEEEERYALSRLPSESTVNFRDLSTSLVDPDGRQNQFIALHARHCPCAGEAAYCLSTPENSQDSCGVNRNSRHPAGCYKQSSKVVFIRNAWPVVMLWFAALFLFLVATDNGKAARDYVLSKIFQDRNDHLVDRVLQREILLRNRLREARAARGGGRTLRTQTLVLKTKRFNSKREREKRRKRRLSRQSTLVEENDTTADNSLESDDGRNINMDNNLTFLMTPERKKPDVSHGTPDTVATSQSDIPCPPDHASPTGDESDPPKESYVPQISSTDRVCVPCGEDAGSDSDDSVDLTCTICFVEIEDGDKVGALNCHHIFHVACLKQWIKRRNICPLCQEPNIASLRQSDTSSAGQNETAEDGTTTSQSERGADRGSAPEGTQIGRSAIDQPR